MRKSEGEVVTDGTFDGRRKHSDDFRENRESACLPCIKQTPLHKPEQDLLGNEGDLQEWGFPKNTAV